MKVPTRWRLFAIAGALALLADQASKIWARASLTPGARVSVIDGYWDWELSFNPGASFSSFAGMNGARVLLSVLALVAIGAIGWMVHRAREDQRGLAVGLGLIAGGAIGNLIDRVAMGAVTDFAAWRWGEHRWPTFNVADATLLVGVVVLAFASRPSRSASTPAAA
ncbi:MAG: signal peptidase II [Deltaproteobacteria bacterium]|nr:signal peptidase II [Deltaproteobacteria bacterium]